MDINSAEVSAAVVTILTPFIPYLVNAAKFSASAISEMIVQKGAEATWQRAQTIWAKISGRYANDDVIHGAALMLAAQPENEQFQSTLAHQLAVRLKEDQELLLELRALIGGQESIQKVLADKGLVKDVIQKMSGTSGTQIIEAKNKGEIRGVKQITKK